MTYFRVDKYFEDLNYDNQFVYLKNKKSIYQVVNLKKLAKEVYNMRDNILNTFNELDFAESSQLNKEVKELYELYTNILLFINKLESKNEETKLKKNI